MWPMLLDYTRDECKRMLRKLELEAYASIVSAFRAQGELTKEKKKMLHDLSSILCISLERHRAEIRRAVNDERLNTIADRIVGPNTNTEWAIEGRRLIPLMPRLVPQTAFSAIANNAANIQAAKNAAMPPPSATGLKESTSTSSSPHSVPSAPSTPTRTPTPTSSSRNATTNGNSNSSAKVTTPATTGNVVVLPSGMSIHIKGGDNTSEEDANSKKRKRSLSLDSVSGPHKIVATSPSFSQGGSTTSQNGQVHQPVQQQPQQPQQIPVASTAAAVQTPQTLSPVTSVTTTTTQSFVTTKTVNLPVGPTPVRITLSSQKSNTAMTPSSTPKVILVSTAGTSAAPSLLHHPMNVPIVKTVSATCSTPVVYQGRPSVHTTTSTPSSAATAVTTAPSASNAATATTTTGGTVTTVATLAMTTALTSVTSTVSTPVPSVIGSAPVASEVGSSMITRVRPKTLTLPRQPVKPRQNLVIPAQQNHAIMGTGPQLPSPGTTSVQSYQQTVTGSFGKATISVPKGVVPCRQEGTVKLIAQGQIPVSGGKILPKPGISVSGGNFVMVTTASTNAANTGRLTNVTVSGTQTRVVNVIAASGQGSTVRAINKPISNTGVITIGQRTPHCSALKVTSASGSGAQTVIKTSIASAPKPNVIVVHKAQMWPQGQGHGATLVVSSPTQLSNLPEGTEQVTYIQRQDRGKTPSTLAVFKSSSGVHSSSPVNITVPTPVPVTNVVEVQTTDQASSASTASKSVHEVTEEANAGEKTSEEASAAGKSDSEGKDHETNSLLADICHAAGILPENEAESQSLAEEESSSTVPVDSSFLETTVVLDGNILAASGDVEARLTSEGGDSTQDAVGLLQVPQNQEASTSFSEITSSSTSGTSRAGTKTSKSCAIEAVAGCSKQSSPNPVPNTVDSKVVKGVCVNGKFEVPESKGSCSGQQDERPRKHPKFTIAHDPSKMVPRAAIVGKKEGFSGRTPVKVLTRNKTAEDGSNVIQVCISRDLSKSNRNLSSSKEKNIPMKVAHVITYSSVKSETASSESGASNSKQVSENHPGTSNSKQVSENHPGTPAVVEEPVKAIKQEEVVENDVGATSSEHSSVSVANEEVVLTSAGPSSLQEFNSQVIPDGNANPLSVAGSSSNQSNDPDLQTSISSTSVSTVQLVRTLREEEQSSIISSSIEPASKSALALSNQCVVSSSTSNQNQRKLFPAVVTTSSIKSYDQESSSGSSEPACDSDSFKENPVDQLSMQVQDEDIISSEVDSGQDRNLRNVESVASSETINFTSFHNTVRNSSSPSNLTAMSSNSNDSLAQCSSQPESSAYAFTKSDVESSTLDSDLSSDSQGGDGMPVSSFERTDTSSAVHQASPSFSSDLVSDLQNEVSSGCLSTDVVNQGCTSSQVPRNEDPVNTSVTSEEENLHFETSYVSCSSNNIHQHSEEPVVSEDSTSDIPENIGSDLSSQVTCSSNKSLRINEGHGSGILESSNENIVSDLSQVTCSSNKIREENQSAEQVTEDEGNQSNSMSAVTCSSNSVSETQNRSTSETMPQRITNNRLASALSLVSCSSNSAANNFIEEPPECSNALSADDSGNTSSAISQVTCSSNDLARALHEQDPSSHLVSKNLNDLSSQMSQVTCSSNSRSTVANSRSTVADNEVVQEETVACVVSNEDNTDHENSQISCSSNGNSPETFEGSLSCSNTEVNKENLAPDISQVSCSSKDSIGNLELPGTSIQNDIEEPIVSEDISEVDAQEDCVVPSGSLVDALPQEVTTDDRMDCAGPQNVRESPESNLDSVESSREQVCSVEEAEEGSATDSESEGVSAHVRQNDVMSHQPSAVDEVQPSLQSSETGAINFDPLESTHSSSVMVDAISSTVSNTRRLSSATLVPPPVLPSSVTSTPRIPNTDLLISCTPSVSNSSETSGPVLDSASSSSCIPTEVENKSSVENNSSMISSSESSLSSAGTNLPEAAEVSSANCSTATESSQQVLSSVCSSSTSSEPVVVISVTCETSSSSENLPRAHTPVQNLPCTSASLERTDSDSSNINTTASAEPVEKELENCASSSFSSSSSCSVQSLPSENNCSVSGPSFVSSENAPTNCVVVVVSSASETVTLESLPSTSSATTLPFTAVPTPVRRKRRTPLVLEENICLPVHLSGWARVASGLLERVSKYRGSRRPKGVASPAHWFLEPVNPNDAPGYYEIIKQPMDFSTIKKKLESGKYKDLNDFHVDMLLVKQNCEMYNPLEHEARIDCEEVFTYYLFEYNRLVEKWQKSHLLSSPKRSKTS